MSLTPHEIMALPDGARVSVKWCGGNGPHEYIVRWRDWSLVPVAVSLRPLTNGSEYDVDPLLYAPDDSRALHRVERVL